MRRSHGQLNLTWSTDNARPNRSSRRRRVRPVRPQRLPAPRQGRPGSRTHQRPRGVDDPVGEQVSGKSTAGNTRSGDLPNPCTLLTRAEVSTLAGGKQITQVDEDGEKDGATTRYCQWQLAGGQLAVFLSKTTSSNFKTGHSSQPKVTASATRRTRPTATSTCCTATSRSTSTPASAATTPPTADGEEHRAEGHRQALSRPSRTGRPPPSGTMVRWMPGSGSTPAARTRGSPRAGCANSNGSTWCGSSGR